MELYEKSDVCVHESARVCVCVCGAFGRDNTAFGSDGLLQHTKESGKGGWWILLESGKGFVMNNRHE